jgi:stearoyl-CoA desaturase (delta-9 desaturase)
LDIPIASQLESIAPDDSGLGAPVTFAESAVPTVVSDPSRINPLQKLITVVIVTAPALALVWAVERFWYHGISWLDVGLAVTLYLVSGFGVTLGFHRLFTHHSFRARRWLRIALAIAGSMAVEGSVVSWVSHHRRHHVFADRKGDPHSPSSTEGRAVGQIRGLLHAHAGWLFSGVESPAERWSRDLLADKDIVMVSALTPVWSVLSLVLPFGIGWAVTRSITGALLALLWAGGVRIALLHHVTWSVNSLGHMFGERPYKTKDRSTNIGWLSVPSFGDSWHNSHHAFPAMARHGCDRGQLDPTAALLGVFERFGWASDVRWPEPEQLGRRRVLADPSN